MAEGGIWRTVGGRRVFIKSGQSLKAAMKESGKFDGLGGKKSDSEKKEVKGQNSGLSDQEFMDKVHSTKPKSNEDYLARKAEVDARREAALSRRRPGPEESAAFDEYITSEKVPGVGEIEFNKLQNGEFARANLSGKESALLHEMNYGNEASKLDFGSPFERVRTLWIKEEPWTKASPLPGGKSMGPGALVGGLASPVTKSGKLTGNAKIVLKTIKQHGSADLYKHVTDLLKAPSPNFDRP